MSDFIKNISFIDGEDGVSKAPNVSEALRRSDDPLTPKTNSAKAEPTDAKLTPIEPIRAEPPIRSLVASEPIDPPTRGFMWAGIILGLLTFLALGAWTYSQFLSGSGVSDLTAWEWAGLVCAVIVPTASIIALFVALNALRNLQNRSDRLARISDRLTRADTAVAEDVASLSTIIRREIAAVDARLAETRTALAGFQANLSAQNQDMDATTKTLTERSETVGQALSLHRQAFESLSSTFDAQMEKLSEQINAQRSAFGETTAKAEAELGASKTAIETAGTAIAASLETVSRQSETAQDTLDTARERMAAMVQQVENTTTELDAVYKRQTTHLAAMADRVSTEKDGAEAALLVQTERLSAIDAQIEMTENRLTALVDHARAIHETLTTQITAIDNTLDSADARSQRFTTDLGARVTDAVADARRDMSLMEADLRALQARLRTTAQDTAELDLTNGDMAAPSRVTLRPLDTDFPALEPMRPEPRRETDATLDLVDLIDADDNARTAASIQDASKDLDGKDASSRDVVRRPGDAATPSKKGRPFGRVKDDKPSKQSGWRWRDMLGGIDPLDETQTDQTPAQANSTKTQNSKVVRPPAGVPLGPVSTQAPSTSKPTDGSDVVARLCEVQLAPSAIVDEGTIIEASRKRQDAGKAAMIDLVQDRLDGPVAHLRGVLAADLEFKLRSESFTRTMDEQLSLINDAAEIRAALGSANGRAYLLSAAALNG